MFVPLLCSSHHFHAFIKPFALTGFGFIYIAGWIGWVGRKYLRTVSKEKNPAENEIIINVPLALKIMSSGYIWPVSAWQELINKELIAPTDEITVSPTFKSLGAKI